MAVNLPADFRRTLPWDVVRELAGYVREKRIVTYGPWRFAQHQYCQTCHHNTTLHTTPNRKPWPCGLCDCPILNHPGLDAYVEQWSAQRGLSRPGLPIAVQVAVLARDGMVCRYCGRKVHRRRRGPGKLHFDHVYPRSLGGMDTAGNIVVACARCNLGKHDDPTIVPADWNEGALSRAS